MKEFRIGRKMVGGDHPTYFVADIGANHDGDLQRAIELIQLAATAGADAAKFQNFDAETILSEYGFQSLGRLSHQSGWKRSVWEEYKAASLPLDWTVRLRDTCDAGEIDFFTAPYSFDLIDALSPYVAAWKVGSGDITWHESIRRMAADGKPLLLATGASELAEVRMAMDVARSECDEIVLMQCNTNYTNTPANIGFVNLRVLTTYAQEFPEAVLGLSDHTPGHASVLGAVAFGARVVEKHFTDDRSRQGPDHAFALDFNGWREMVDRTRELEAAFGDPDKRVMGNEHETVVIQRRAVRAGRDLPQGTILDEGHLVMLRPCPLDALPPYRAAALIGRTLVRPVYSGDCVRLEDVR